MSHVWQLMQTWRATSMQLCNYTWRQESYFNILLVSPIDRNWPRGWFSVSPAVFRRALLTLTTGKVLSKVHHKLFITLTLVIFLRLRWFIFWLKENENKTIFYDQLKLIIYSRNRKTLLDHSPLNRPEKRTALVTKELRRLQIDISALSESWLLESIVR